MVFLYLINDKKFTVEIYLLLLARTDLYSVILMMYSVSEEYPFCTECSENGINLILEVFFRR